MPQPTCKERIKTHLDGRIADLSTLWQAYCKGDEDVPNLGNLCEYGLLFDYVAPGTFGNQKEGYWRYQLSWGGPSDEFRFYSSDPHSQPYRIEYWFMDWFDGAHKVLRGKQLGLLLELWGWFEEVGTTESVYQQATVE